MGNRDSQIPLSAKERELIAKVALRDGISEDDAASTNLMKAAIARKAKKRGTPGARVLPIRKR